jgi:hypothetical protein
MWCTNVLAGIVIGLLLTTPAGGQPAARTPIAAAPSPAAAPAPRNPLPIVGLMLDHETELGLSRTQVEDLERLGLDVMRETIRRQADLMIAGLDLWVLVDRDPDEGIDTAKAEVKIRETERIRADFQLAVVRATEAAKNQLAGDQRAKLTALLLSQDAATIDPPDPPGQADAAARSSGGGHPRPGGAGRPQIPAGPRLQPRGGIHGHIVIGGPSWWWNVPYPYWNYPGWAYGPPPVVTEPPIYVERPQPAPQAYWYYCRSYGAYYPNVQTCPEPWVSVTPNAG